MTFTIGIGPNLRKSPYFDATVRDGVRSFSVYNHMLIPGHFGDPDGEYDALLNGVVMWDVAAQRQVEIFGPDAGRLVQYLTPRNLSGVDVGQGRYVPLCDHEGWIINDPVLLKLAKDRYWLSVADSDIHLWAAAIGREKGWNVCVVEPDVSPLAIQGPKSVDVVAALFGERVRGFKYFAFEEADLDGIPLVLARSGWSKQGGFELYLMDGRRGTELWDRVRSAGAPFGIRPGAPNDIERIESGLISYGADMRLQDYKANPFEMGFGKLVDLNGGHDFVGREALKGMSATGVARKLVGVFIEGTPEFPGHQLPLLVDGQPVGYITEFCHSRRLDRTIGIALVENAAASGGARLSFRLAQKEYNAEVAQLPFI